MTGAPDANTSTSPIRKQTKAGTPSVVPAEGFVFVAISGRRYCNFFCCRLPRVPDAPQAAARPAKAFWALWAFDALIATVVVFFFLWGLADGTVSSFNIVLWLGMLGLVAAVVGGGLALKRSGRTKAAITLLMVLAFPGFCFVVFFGALLILQPRWN